MLSRILSGIRRNPYILAAAALAGLAGLLVHGYLARFAQTVPVVVAARHLPAPRRLQAEDLKVVPLPADGVHPQAFHDPRSLIGEFLTATAAAGQPILAPLVRPASGAGSALQAWLQPDETAIFLPLPPDRGVGGAVLPGDRVDVIFVGPSSRAQAQRLVAGARVLDVRDAAGNSLAESGERGSPMAGFTLAVHRRDAERLAFAMEHGRLFAALTPESSADSWGAGAPVDWSNLLEHHSLSPWSHERHGAGEAAEETGAFPDGTGDGSGEEVWES